MTPRFATLALFASLSLGFGCSKKTPEPETNPTAGAAETPAPTKKEIPESVAKMIGNFQRVYFDFNKFELADESREALEMNAELMKTYPEIRIEIQGHADERGTSEYNLALGDKRAKAVRDYMVRLLGGAENRIEIISYGEEKPIDESSTEVAWSKNRRAEFRLLWKGSEQVAGTVD